MMPKLFFTSYTHVNRDKCLEKFVETLRDEVLHRGPGTLKREDVVFFDSEGIQTGDDWVKKLSAAVTHCKVCIAVCSPAYVSSEFCGKEVRVFLERLLLWEARPGNAAMLGRSIIPIIWVKVKLPDVLERFQYDEKEFPPDYREHGLRTLFQLNKYRDKRMQVVITLAERILTAAEMDLPPKDPIPHFDMIPSIFHEQPRSTRYNVVLVPLLKDNVGAKPYRQGQTLRNLMHAACASRIPWRTLTQDAKLEQCLREAKENREAILIVADLETLQDPIYTNTVAAVDAAAGEQSAILLLRSEEQSASAAQDKDVEITLQGCFPNALPKAWHRDWSSIRSVDSLSKTLVETITELRSRLVKEDPACAASDPHLTAAAAAAGIPIERQPVLSGPGGMGS